MDCYRVQIWLEQQATLHLQIYKSPLSLCVYKYMHPQHLWGAGGHSRRPWSGI